MCLFAWLLLSWSLACGLALVGNERGGLLLLFCLFKGQGAHDTNDVMAATGIDCNCRARKHGCMPRSAPPPVLMGSGRGESQKFGRRRFINSFSEAYSVYIQGPFIQNMGMEQI